MNHQPSTICFIGAGNMAEALVSGIVSKGVCPAANIVVTDIAEARLAIFREKFGVGTETDNRKAVDGKDIVVLAVKPQVMTEVLDELRGAIGEKTLVISIAAGLRSTVFESALGDRIRLVRVMPNTPALVGLGAAAIASGSRATDDDLAVAEKLLGSVGIVVRVDEDAMDAVTALSGSGPAYVFYLIEHMLKAADELGMDADTARGLVLATVQGAAKLMSESGSSAEDLRARVTSKGGTTAAAVAVFEKSGVGEAIVNAVKAAEHRSKELSGS
ncbi:MAG: pyrroline-5-carboxylate reductase [Verrucomicrobia bacterium]|nr:pyrroline-5-carboxylate reductase [Verrucomicrobiota bacterium]